MHVHSYKQFMNSFHSCFVPSAFPDASVFASHSGMGSSVYNKTYSINDIFSQSQVLLS